jgi:hypothetical protein
LADGDALPPGWLRSTAWAESGRGTRTRGGDGNLEGEREAWREAAQIRDDYGDEAEEYVFRVTRDAKGDHEQQRRWFSIIDKMQALNGTDGLLQ